MFTKLINMIKLLFLARKIKKQYRMGTLVFQPETLMYFIVSGYDKQYCYLQDEYKMLTPVRYVDLTKYYMTAQDVTCPELITKFKILQIDEKSGTILLEGRGFVTLQDLNEGNF